MEVVLFHYLKQGGRVESATRNTFRGLWSGGYEAVTFFFLLSGFILTYVYAESSEPAGIRTTARQFWRARVARIVPAYYLGLCLTLPPLLYGAFIAGNIMLSRLLPSLFLAPVFLQSWWAPSALTWNGPGWSLSVECLFYAMFPWISAITRRIRAQYFLTIAYLLVLIVEIGQLSSEPFLRASLGPYVARNLIGYFPLFHLPTFLVGMAIGRFYIGRNEQRRSSVAWRAVFLLCIFLLLFSFGFRPVLPGWIFRNSLLVPLFSLLIYSCACAENDLRILQQPILVKLGEASYALYIIHDALPFWWDEFWHKLMRVHLSPITDCVALITVVVLVSYFLFAFLETPLRRRILGHRENRMA
jgi:peptidoglycan/LPS O-acetylase OafA/YrhL